ncbi:MAG: hypothetical protein ACRDPW_08315 [Mycobacteriales bacterium]
MNAWQRLHQRRYVPALIVVTVLLGVMVVLSIAQRDRAGNEPIPELDSTTSSSSATGPSVNTSSASGAESGS